MGTEGRWRTRVWCSAAFALIRPVSSDDAGGLITATQQRVAAIMADDFPAVIIALVAILLTIFLFEKHKLHQAAEARARAAVERAEAAEEQARSAEARAKAAEARAHEVGKKTEAVEKQAAEARAKAAEEQAKAAEQARAADRQARAADKQAKAAAEQAKAAEARAKAAETKAYEESQKVESAKKARKNLETAVTKEDATLLKKEIEDAKGAGMGHDEMRVAKALLGELEKVAAGEAEKKSKEKEEDVRKSKAVFDAVEANKTAEVLALLKAGADPNEFKKVGGYTALLVASPKGKVDIVTALLNHGAHVDARSTCDGLTALMEVSIKGHVDIAKLLVKHGANTGLKDSSGRTAMDLANKYHEGAKLNEFAKVLGGPGSCVMS